MAILKYGQWAIFGLAGIALGFVVWRVAHWEQKAARVDAAEKAQELAQSAIAQERAYRAKVDLDRLAASASFTVKVQGIEERTTVLIRQRDRLVPVDRPCLDGPAVDALNEGREK